MSSLYLQPMQGGRWAISRTIAGKRVYLVQNTKVECLEDIRIIFHVLDIEHTSENIARYFPKRDEEDHAPTLELLELFSTIDRPFADALGGARV
jgi:hypothetical protein